MARLLWMCVRLCLRGRVGVAVCLVTLGAIPARAEAPSRADVIGLAVGTGHTCSVHADGSVSCWGMNNHGQLGLRRR